MKANWEKLIASAKVYVEHLESRDDRELKEDTLKEEVKCLEAILRFCEDEWWQRMYSEYMACKMEVSKDKIEQLKKDLQAKREEMTRVVRENVDFARKSKHSYQQIYTFLCSFSESDREDKAYKFYCPDEYITKENLPYLEAIVDIATKKDATKAIKCTDGKSVIGDLVSKITALKENT